MFHLKIQMAVILIMSPPKNPSKCSNLKCDVDKKCTLNANDYCDIESMRSKVSDKGENPNKDGTTADVSGKEVQEDSSKNEVPDDNSDEADEPQTSNERENNFAKI